MVYAAKHCTKLSWNEINNIDDVRFAARLGSLLMDGEDLYRQNPVFLCVKCSISPLKIGPDSAEILWEFAQRELPFGVAPMPLAGGSSPVTPAATLLIANAEILGMIVALYAVGSASKHEHLALTGIMDMQTSIASFSPPNVVLQDVAQILSQTPVFKREESLCREIDRLYDAEAKRRNSRTPRL